MKTRLCFSFILCLFLYSHCVSGQEIPVDMFTGTPSVQVPLASISDYDLSSSVSLSYSAGGVKLKESGGICGIGWTLIGGGEISREVRALPDDFTDTLANPRRGWLFKNSTIPVSTYPASFFNTADLSSSTCPDETTDFNALNGYAYNIDTEPDIFTYAIGSFSGKFVFDNADPAGIRLIPYRDVKIEPIYYSGTYKKIKSFKITTNDGIVYTFARQVSTTRRTHKLTTATFVHYFKREFELYDSARFNAKVKYNSRWLLTKVESPSGAFIDYTYSDPEDEPFVDKKKVSIGLRANGSSVIVSKQIYEILTETETRNLKTIQGSSGGKLELTYQGGRLSSVKQTDLRRSPDVIRGAVLGYQQVTKRSASTGSNQQEDRRYFLSSVQVTGTFDDCNTFMPPYRFTYIGVFSLPMFNSKSVDFWGYYNGKTNTTLYPTIYVYPALSIAERYRLTPIPGYAGTSYTIAGADRTPDVTSSQLGSLQTIQYPAGGSTTFNYEPHTYFDPTANATLTGGGLRVKSIVYFDGMSPASKVVKNFYYDESLNKSSGRLITQPAFAMPMFQYRDPANEATTKAYATLAAGPAQDMWEYLTARTEEDISSGETTQKSNVGYGVVKVTRPGAGWAISEFLLPGAFGTAATGDWIPSQNKFARSPNCFGMGVVSTGGDYAFPYAPNPNYDHERGLISKQTTYSETGAKVQEINTTYASRVKTGTTPYKVYGVRYERFVNATDEMFFFSKYFLLTDIDKVVATEQMITYDAANVAKNISTLTEYTYGSTNHKLLTKIKTTLPDTTVYVTEMKYPLDYGTLSGTLDQPLAMIKQMQTDFRNGSPLETVNKMQKRMGTEMVTGANLIKFSDFGTNSPTRILPQYTLSLTLASPLPASSFVWSDKLLSGSTYTLKTDPNYEVVGTVLSYDKFQRPLSSIDISNVVSGTHWGHKKTLPVAMISNAYASQLAFSNFETTFGDVNEGTGYEFQATSVYTGTGRASKTALHPIVTLTRDFAKASVSNYTLSFWLKKESSTVTFNLKLKDPIAGTVHYETTLNAAPVGTEFEYFEFKIPVTLVPAGSFRMELQGQFPGGTTVVSSPTLKPVMDDVAFYPENAELTTMSYDIPYGAASVTDTRGNTMYTEYDKLGRVKYVLDGERNIVKKNTYAYGEFPDPQLDLEIQATEPPTDYSYLSLSASVNPCLDGTATYQWNFEGLGIQNGANASVYYTTLGAKPYTLTVTHPAFPIPQVIYGALNIVQRSFTPALCGKGISSYDKCTLATTGTYSCAAITSTPPGESTIFKVSGLNDIPPGETAASYQWQKRPVSSSTWSNVTSGTTDQITINHIELLTESQVYQCIVTSNTGRIGYSSPITITITSCP